MKIGAAKDNECIKKPDNDEDAAHPALRATFVVEAAKVRSSGRTTAAVYDWRVGTSISTRASRHNRRPAATGNDGAKGTAMRNRLEGRCVNTIVFTRPMRRASHAAPRCEVAFRT